MQENTLRGFGHFRERMRNPGLSVLLFLEVLVIFLLVPIRGLALFGPPSSQVFGATLVVIAAVVVIARHRVVLALTLIAAAFAVLADIYRYEWPSHVSAAAFLIVALVFFLVLTAAIGHVVFGPGRVTAHRIQGAIVVYLHVALIFTYLYAVVLIFEPGAFGDAIATSDPSVGAKVLYFSFTTLTTVGYGDITPVHPLARSLSNLEAIIGQLYPATLLARLVTLEISSRESQ
ncbi:MAG TPA: potassium channel family protein [Stellaceae bacterium]|nr:potassium channel family protein [Stellaceae bacterium]